MEQIKPSRNIYHREVESIRRELGGLEDIRSRLGLSRRKICQLLLVDPSAWTRWTREGQDAPPHIYRALSWYLKNGDTQEENSNRSGQRPKKLESEVESLQRQLEELRKELLKREHQHRPVAKPRIEARRKWPRKWLFFGQVLVFALIYWLAMRKI